MEQPMPRRFSVFLAVLLAVLGSTAGTRPAHAAQTFPPKVYSHTLSYTCPRNDWRGDLDWQHCALVFPAAPPRGYLRIDTASCLVSYQYQTGKLARVYLASVPKTQYAISLKTKEPDVSFRKFEFVFMPATMMEPGSGASPPQMQVPATLPGGAVFGPDEQPVVVASMNERRTQGAIRLICTLVGDLLN